MGHSHTLISVGSILGTMHPFLVHVSEQDEVGEDHDYVKVSDEAKQNGWCGSWCLAITVCTLTFAAVLLLSMVCSDFCLFPFLSSLSPTPTMIHTQPALWGLAF